MRIKAMPAYCACPSVLYFYQTYKTSSVNYIQCCTTKTELVVSLSPSTQDQRQVVVIATLQLCWHFSLEHCKLKYSNIHSTSSSISVTCSNTPLYTHSTVTCSLQLVRKSRHAWHQQFTTRIWGMCSLSKIRKSTTVQALYIVHLLSSNSCIYAMVSSCQSLCPSKVSVCSETSIQIPDVGYEVTLDQLFYTVTSDTFSYTTLTYWLIPPPQHSPLKGIDARTPSHCLAFSLFLSLFLSCSLALWPLIQAHSVISPYLSSLPLHALLLIFNCVCPKVSVLHE